MHVELYTKIMGCVKLRVWGLRSDRAFVAIDRSCVRRDARCVTDGQADRQDGRTDNAPPPPPPYNPKD